MSFSFPPSASQSAITEMHKFDSSTMSNTLGPQEIVMGSLVSNIVYSGEVEVYPTVSNSVPTRMPAGVPSVSLANTGNDACAALKPREQDVRAPDDSYTPKWVRGVSQKKEGLCDLCPPPGRWLQLKNSAFWYHKQFTHGISSISFRPFRTPIQMRSVLITTTNKTPSALSGERSKARSKNSATNASGCSTHLMLEGECDTCRCWVPLLPAKRRASSFPKSMQDITAMLLAFRSPTGSLPMLVESDAPEISTKVVAARCFETGQLLIPPFLEPNREHLLEGVEAAIRAEGFNTIWFRHAAKCHDQHKPKPSRAKTARRSSASSNVK
eukprot:jgi/Hompol1/2668/HPOL_003011-RA